MRGDTWVATRTSEFLCSWWEAGSMKVLETQRMAASCSSVVMQEVESCGGGWSKLYGSVNPPAGCPLGVRLELGRTLPEQETGMDHLRVEDVAQ